jgi:signal transduction histidine kinase
MRAVVVAVFCADAAVSLLAIWQAGEGIWRTGLAFVLLGLMVYIQLAYFSRPGSWVPSRRSYALLAVQAALAYVPMLGYHGMWIGLQTFFTGSVLLVLPAAAAWPLFAAIVGSATWLEYSLTNDTTLGLLYTGLSAAVLGVNVYLLSRLAGLVGELHKARNELAQLAVADERLRFARDLHDLLGLSLSAITLKGELAHRLVHAYPARAKQEVMEILDVARRALADVRSVAKGYQDLSLEQEAWSAKSVLAASNIDTHLELDYQDLPVPVRTTLGTVLREGVTNVLRHSKAEHCEIVVRQAAGAVCLDIFNDGVGEDDDTEPDADSGSGIRNLSGRVAELSGETTAGLEPDGRFRLHVVIPLATERFEPDDQHDGPDDQPVGKPAGGRPAGADRSAPGSGRPDGPIRERTTSPIHARSTSVLITAFFFGIVMVAVVHLLFLTADPVKRASGIGFLAALLILQLAYFNRVGSRPGSGLSYALLFVQAALIYLPLIQLGPAWISQPGFLAGSALLMLSPLLGWTVFCAVVGSVVWVHVVATGKIFDIAFNGSTVVITGLIVFGVTSLTRLIAELAETRTQLARMAISEERLRFARDLHDLLGLSLSAMTLKSELTLRLMDIDPDKAAEELVEILGLARQALADVRSVASSYRELSLDDEYRSAESVLTAADVRVRMDVQYTELPVLVRTVLAVVLREGVTNVLRHCKAEHCDIVIRQADGEVSLDIVNDGVGMAELLPANGVNGSAVVAGSGIRNLSYRVAKVGGELRTGLDEDGRFRLRVGVPV